MTERPKPRAFRHPSFQGQIGIARVDITPPVGVYARNWGAAKHDVARTIHRPLTLTAMSLTAADGPTVVYIDADLGWWKSLQKFREFRDRLLEELSLEACSVIFALSHTHSAPPLMDADKSLPGSELHRAWMRTLFEQTVDAARQALTTTFEGTLEWSRGRCGLATNRDLADPDATKDRIVCGYNPDAQPDDSLLVGRITDVAGAMRAVLVNYACHPTTLAWDNEAISPDYVGAMRETIQQSVGVPALFMLGACGELAPRFQYVGDTAVADRHGRELAFAALAVLHGMEPPRCCLEYRGVVESGAPLAVWCHSPHEPSRALRTLVAKPELRLKDWPTADELERQRSACADRALEERLRRKLNIRLAIGDGLAFQVDIHAWRIGDVVVVGSCCEAYSVLHRELCRRFPHATIVCMNLINGSIGYLPPAELYDADLYTVWQTPFERGCLEHVLESMTVAIHNVLND